MGRDVGLGIIQIGDKPWEWQRSPREKTWRSKKLRKEPCCTSTLQVLGGDHGKSISLAESSERTIPWEAKTGRISRRRLSMVLNVLER